MSKICVIPENTINVSLDIETLSIRPGGVILTIGAVEFNRGGVGVDEGFYVRIDLEDSVNNHNMTIDVDTLRWWLGLDASELAELVEGPADDPMSNPYPLPLALRSLAAWLKNLKSPEKPDILIWTRGSMDTHMLAEAYRRIGDQIPWEFYNERDQRTISRSYKGDVVIKKRPDGKKKHNAYYDAIHQADELVEIQKQLDGDPK